MTLDIRTLARNLECPAAGTHPGVSRGPEFFLPARVPEVNA